MGPLRSRISRAAEALKEHGARRFIRGAYKATVQQQLHQRDLRKSYDLRSIPDGYDLVEVDPSQVNLIVRPPFRETYTRFGSWVIGGSWDQRTWNIQSDEKLRTMRGSERKLQHIDDYDIYRGMKHHFEADVPWQETEFYQRRLKWIRRGHSCWHGCTKVEDLNERCAYIDSLYETILKEGYKTQRELAGSSNTNALADEVAMALTRDGEFVLEDGRHRLFISRLLEIDTIPVRIAIRHRGWQEVRHAVSLTDDHGQIRSCLEKHNDHPDLENLGWDGASTDIESGESNNN